MNSYVHTLTAYRLVFSYLKRNNPLKEELEENIKNDDKPLVNIKDVFEKLRGYTNEKNIEKLISNDKIIALKEVNEFVTIDSNTKRMFIRPNSGPINKSTLMLGLEKNSKDYRFNNSTHASTHSHNMFLYQIEDEYYLVCHRHAGSGCKTVLSGVLNKILKDQGIRVSFNFMMYHESERKNIKINNISLIVEDVPSDIADSLKNKTKKKPIEEFKISLSSKKFCLIKDKIDKYRINEISREDFFEEINNEFNISDFNNVRINIKIGKHTKNVSLDNFENMFEGYDITDIVEGLEGSDFIERLTVCSDQFVKSLLFK